MGIRYYVLDVTNLKDFPSNRFHLATCFMSLQDIRNYKKAISKVSRVLRNRARFIFSIPHPCFETIVVNGKRVSIRERYFGKARYPVHWKMERIVKPFTTTSFHRTLTDYFDALFKSNLLVARLVEPKLTLEGLRKHPAIREALLRLQSIIIESMKCPGFKDL